ncbi:MAG TPA: hypothetical protein VM346_06405 [Sphingomicrobium sp.]|nr:hypothetical protein [Sphingomicrobium sp.]
MDRKFGEMAATERARWLADLAAAIEQAQKLAWRLGVTEGNDPDALELYARLELARDEVDALRRGRWAREQGALDPIWMKFLPWRTQMAESSD